MAVPVFDTGCRAAGDDGATARNGLKGPVVNPYFANAGNSQKPPEKRTNYKRDARGVGQSPLTTFVTPRLDRLMAFPLMEKRGDTLNYSIGPADRPQCCAPKQSGTLSCQTL